MDNELTHYGVLGMRWGVRKARKNSSSSGSKKKKSLIDENVSDDYKRAHTAKSVKQMSDKELREKLNRLQMERQYSQLSASDVSSGKSFVDKLIKTGSTVAAITGTGLTIYNNINKITDIVKKAKG